MSESDTQPVGGPKTNGSRPSASSATVEGNDAVCFTAGISGAVFGAGTIHAYLASARKSPRVAAGISMGALNAAAMQRTYRELSGAPPDRDSPQREAARWRWFREYVHALSDQPLNVFWDAIPDKSDFFADMVPIVDTSTPESLKERETDARKRRYLLVRLGRWLASLPLGVSVVASSLVHWVRLKERYTTWQKLQSFLAIVWSLIALLTRVIIHACFSPQLFPVQQFDAARGQTSGGSWSLPRRGLNFLAWLNRFAFTLLVIVMLINSLAIALTAGGLADPDADAFRAVLPYLLGAALTWLVLFKVLEWARPLTKRVLDWGVVKNGVLPLLAWIIYLVSWINAICFVVVIASSGWIVFRQRTDVAVVLAITATLIMSAFYALLFPLYLVPEIKNWLRAKGLLQARRRPLFGWQIYLFVLVHFVSLATYLILGLTLPDWRDSTKEFLGFQVNTVGGVFLLAPLVTALVTAALIGGLRLFLRKRDLLRDWPRPRVGWGLFRVASVAIMLATSTGYLYLLEKFGESLSGGKGSSPGVSAFLFATSILYGTWLVIFTILAVPELGRHVFRQILTMLDIRRGLIDDFFLRRKLTELFDPDWKKNIAEAEPPQAKVQDQPMDILLVAAPLHTLYDIRDGRCEPLTAYQLWAKPDTPLIDALRTALAVPPLYRPKRLRITDNELKNWLKSSVLEVWKTSKETKTAARNGLELVDGSVIRHNPLPALFSYLRLPEKADLARQIGANNDREYPAIHVIYRGPIEKQSPPEKPEYTIVDVARLSLQLSQRRDTQLEVQQTNFISRLESEVLKAAPEGAKDAPFPIFADEIAPEKDLAFKNGLNPTPEEVFTGIASGCRRTLEKLHKSELLVLNPGSDTVRCDTLLRTLLPNRARAEKFLSPAPGLPEVCKWCTGRLQKPPQKAEQSSTVKVETTLGSLEKFHRELRHLCTGQPRIVLVANGGVFRGAFHIGMLAALRCSDIKPDLIVGASVGTLMGGAMAAMFSNPGILGELVYTFLHVDDLVALTKTLKSATRELGLRGRFIKLSPNDVRRMVLRGSRSDPGFAVAGAPAALIDAISDLFMIPHRQTASIAAAFVAGHVTRATDMFWRQFKKETLSRLNIRHALIGTSLLESTARRLMGAEGLPLNSRQPFAGNGIAFFGTTTNLVEQTPMLLGGFGVHPDAPYDYVEAALASSAFPAVFAPRRESSVFPGIGSAEILFADGGMFDNLPFLPAIEILACAQRAYRTLDPIGQQQTALDFLKNRVDSPDLLIAGALDAKPQGAADAMGPFDTIVAINKRAGTLADDVKIRSFQKSSKRIHEQLSRLHAAAPASTKSNSLQFADDVVNSAVLPVFPASSSHLNGTFAFCASTGLKKRRVQKSIADGCYQTFAALAKAFDERRQDDLPSITVRALSRLGRIKLIAWRSKEERRAPKEHCPFFKRSGQDFLCPFAGARATPREKEVSEVFDICKTDSEHFVPKHAEQPQRVAPPLTQTAAQRPTGPPPSEPQTDVKEAPQLETAKKD